MIGVRRLAPLFVTIALCAGCSSGTVSPRSPSPAPSPAVMPTASPRTTPPSPAPSQTSLTTWQVGGGVVGVASTDTAYPRYLVQVPGGWVASGEFVIGAGPKVMGLSVWDAIQVPTDPCRWSSTMTTPGPTVDDLVKALVAQRTRNASAPVQATLAGYKGEYLEWSVPPDMVDGEKCDPWPDNGYRDFVSFLGVGGSERYQQLANQIDRLWVLDVNGQRLVVDATYSADATDAQKTELDQVAKSLRFDEP
jgi:hypothetical protein